ncbi:hypothetical protein AGMMS50293_02490 [Spirochaetia bacterium]|nr:hypothetical protein AGMMS50293_02490 [Spirochaetia bacterium]
MANRMINSKNAGVVCFTILNITGRLDSGKKASHTERSNKGLNDYVRLASEAPLRPLDTFIQS